MKLSDYLREKEIKQNDFAELAEISQATVSRIINNPKYLPRLPKLRKIEEATGGAVSVSDFG